MQAKRREFHDRFFRETMEWMRENRQNVDITGEILRCYLKDWAAAYSDVGPGLSKDSEGLLRISLFQEEMSLPPICNARCWQSYE